jgi:hypothetical protein
MPIPHPLGCRLRPPTCKLRAMSPVLTYWPSLKTKSPCTVVTPLYAGKQTGGYGRVEQSEEDQQAGHMHYGAAAWRSPTSRPGLQGTSLTSGSPSPTARSFSTATPPLSRSRPDNSCGGQASLDQPPR